MLRLLCELIAASPQGGEETGSGPPLRAPSPWGCAQRGRTKGVSSLIPSGCERDHRSSGMTVTWARVPRASVVRTPPSPRLSALMATGILWPLVSGGDVHATRLPFDPGSPATPRSSAGGGCRRGGGWSRVPGGCAGGLSHSGGASIAIVVFFKLGITSSDLISGTKKGDSWVALAKIRSASRSYRASLPARTTTGVNPNVRSQCSCRVPIAAWMWVEFFISWSGRLGERSGAVKVTRNTSVSVARTGSHTQAGGRTRPHK